MTVQGTFSGLVEPDGLMNLAGLTGFQAFVSVHTGFGTANAVSVALPTFFSFNTLSSPNASGGNSSLAFFVMMSDDGYTTGQNLCVGSATFLKCGVSGVAGAYSSVPLTTTAYPHVTLVSSTAVTPIPAPILLFATALSGLGLLGAQACRRQRAA